MADMTSKKTLMPQQDPQVRSKNFSEVALGYDETLARREAQRCLGCKAAPCMQGCPVNVQIPDFIRLIASGDFEGAYGVIRRTNSLPAICGRVCPQETQCEQKCLRGKKGEPVAIGRLERFAADWHMTNAEISADAGEKTRGRVAVVGSGPAGLTCAGDLAQMGYDVTVFEAFHTPGGVLMYGIPEFRLPKDLVLCEIGNVCALGVKIETDMVIGRVLSLDELMESGFEAVFIGSGAGLPSFMGIPGENLNGVYSANEFLTRVNLMKAYRFPESDTPVRIGRNVAVIGGGNVAMDAARCAIRLGAAHVDIVYRRSEAELPARREEVEHAKEEGVSFRLLTSPTRVIGTDDGWVKGLACLHMALGEPDASGRRRPVEIAGSAHTLEADTVIVAIGTSPNPLIKMTTAGLNTQKWGGIVVDEQTGATSREGVYAGGDAVTGAATVILAMGAGKRAAAAIDAYLCAKRSAGVTHET